MRVDRIGGFPPEDLAALLSSWARSPDDLQAHTAELVRQGALTPSSARGPASRPSRAALLHSYGHTSNAEHAVVHLMLEGISLLAARTVLDARLASFTEKAGRHRSPPDVAVPIPAELEDPAARSLFTEHVERLAAARRTFRGPLRHHIERTRPVRENETPEQAQDRAGSQARSMLRQLVPLGALSELCVSANARTLRGLITKLASSPAEEQRRLASAMRDAALPALPSLLEFAGPSPYRIDTERALATWSTELLGPAGAPADELIGAVLVRTPEDVEERLVAAILYRHTGQGYRSVRTRVAGLDQDTRQAVVDEYLARRGRHDEPLRELEHVQYTFEIVLDAGALREVLRHRITSRTPQPLTVRHGYLIDPEVTGAGLEDGWRAVLDDAAEACELLAGTSPVGALSLIPLGFRQRVLMTWNLRALHYFVQLRSRRNGNRSVRRIAQDVYRQIERAHPLVARSMRVDLEDEGLPGGR